MPFSYFFQDANDREEFAFKQREKGVLVLHVNFHKSPTIGRKLSGQIFPQQIRHRYMIQHTNISTYLRESSNIKIRGLQ